MLLKIKLEGDVKLLSYLSYNFHFLMFINYIIFIDLLPIFVDFAVKLW